MGERHRQPTPDELRAFVEGRLDAEELRLASDPEATTDDFMVDLNRIARPERPLVLLVDTYELGDRCDRWVRQRLLPLSGPRLVWVIAGREGQPFVRRYEDEFGAGLARGILLDTFARPDIAAYVRECGVEDPSEALIERLQALSRGVPLALEGWFNLHQKQVELPPPDLAAPTTRRAIVQRLTDRFLRYCNDDDRHLSDAERQRRTATRNRILALMLLRHTDAAALAAAWQCDVAGAEAALDDLADQFSFVFAQEIERQPHALVKEILREWLREQPALPAALQANVERLAAHFERRMREREVELGDVGPDPGAEELALPRRPLWDDEAWREALLSRVNALCWAERGGERAMRLLVPLWIEALEFHPPSAGELLEVAREFAQGWPQERRQLVEVGKSLTTIGGVLAAVRFITADDRLKDKQLAIFDALLAAATSWRLTSLQRAIVHIRRGGLLLAGDALEKSEQRSRALHAADEAAGLLRADGGEVAEALGRLYAEVGSRFLWQGQRDASASPEAERALSAAVQYVQTNQTAWYNLGAARYKLNQHEAALAAYQQAIALDPKDAYPHNGLGNVYSDLGQHEAALVAYQQAIALDPKYAYAHNGLGNVYDALGQHEAALAAYQQAIALDPNYAAPYNGLGNVYSDLGQHEAALVAYQEAIALDPNNAVPRHGLGNVYRNLGQHEAALAAYQQAIALAPNNAAPHHGLGNVYSDLGLHEAALAAYQQAIAFDPNNATPYSGLGNLYSILERIEEARSAYRRAADLDSTSYIAMFSLARLARQAGNLTEAKYWIDRARPLLPEQAHYNLAYLESIAGNVDAALDALRVALEQRPGVRGWARRDPDFDFIRDDPRFGALVGGGELPRDE